MVSVDRIVRRVQSLMNDQIGAVFTNDVVMPYLNMAYDSLQEIFELNNMPVTDASSALIAVPVGTTQIHPFPTEPFYPQDLVEIKMMWERDYGSTDPYTIITKLDNLPLGYDNILTPLLGVYTWNGTINFLGATTPRDVKLDYTKTLFSQELIPGGVIPQNGVEPYLYYRTAAMIAMFIGENETRAAALQMEADRALERELGIGTKPRQQITTRRKPFMASYRGRGLS